MSIGLAIVLVAIIGFAIYSRGFRWLLLWLAVAVGVVVIALFVHQTNVEHQEQQKARIEADKRQQQLEAERREIEQEAPQLCSALGTRKQCMEDTEAACRSYWSLGERKGCMTTAARWCPDEGTRKQCIADTLRAQEQARRAELAGQEELAQQAQQRQHDAWCGRLEQQIPEAMQRWRIRGGLYWEWLPEDYRLRRDCPNVEKAIDRAIAGGN